MSSVLTLDRAPVSAVAKGLDSPFVSVASLTVVDVDDGLLVEVLSVAVVVDVGAGAGLREVKSS